MQKPYSESKKNNNSKPNWGLPPDPHTTYSLLPNQIKWLWQKLTGAISDTLRLSGCVFRVYSI